MHEHPAPNVRQMILSLRHHGHGPRLETLQCITTLELVKEQPSIALSFQFTKWMSYFLCFGKKGRFIIHNVYDKENINIIIKHDIKFWCAFLFTNIKIGIGTYSCAKLEVAWLYGGRKILGVYTSTPSDEFRFTWSHWDTCLGERHCWTLQLILFSINVRTLPTWLSR